MIVSIMYEYRKAELAWLTCLSVIAIVSAERTLYYSMGSMNSIAE